MIQSKVIWIKKKKLGENASKIPMCCFSRPMPSLGESSAYHGSDPWNGRKTKDVGDGNYESTRKVWEAENELATKGKSKKTNTWC